MPYLFVYGTLKRGGPRHHLLSGQRFLGRARTAPGFALYDLGAYPGLVCAVAAGSAVEGELYEIDDGLRPELDEAEGAPLLYRLEPIDLVEFAIPVFTYVYQRAVEADAFIAAGRWSNRSA